MRKANVLHRTVLRQEERGKRHPKPQSIIKKKKLNKKEPKAGCKWKDD